MMDKRERKSKISNFPWTKNTLSRRSATNSENCRSKFIRFIDIPLNLFALLFPILAVSTK